MFLLFNVFLFMGVFFASVKDTSAESWRYGESDSHEGPGVSHWGDAYPACNGQAQSPIDIEKGVEQDSDLEYFDFSDYNKAVHGDLLNYGGHTAQVTLPDDPPVYIRGGSLPGNYQLIQFHFHWGKGDDYPGSEHTIGGVRQPMEMHLVHRDPSKAEDEPGAFAVIAFFINENPKDNVDNPAFDRLLQHFDRIKKADTQTSLGLMRVADLLPDDINNMDYVRYAGSLTTPPCYESVIWSIAATPILISENQMEKFQTLLDTDGRRIQNNYRPTQPLNDRDVTGTSAGNFFKI